VLADMDARFIRRVKKSDAIAKRTNRLHPETQSFAVSEFSNDGNALPEFQRARAEWMNGQKFFTTAFAGMSEQRQMKKWTKKKVV
jgi:hypothetical protein